LKNLSILVRESADHARWRNETLALADSLGCTDRAVVEVAWRAIDTIISSVTTLAFAYRHRTDDLAQEFEPWLAACRAKLGIEIAEHRDRPSGVEREELFDQIVLQIVSRLFAELELAYRQHSTSIRSRQVFDSFSPPRLDISQADAIHEIAGHLRRASVRVKQLQKSQPESRFEWEAYSHALDALVWHFQAMSSGTEIELAA
jgi:hypothetical protein